jgi:hypothetical protein
MLTLLALLAVASPSDPADLHTTATAGAPVPAGSVDVQEAAPSKVLPIGGAAAGSAAGLAAGLPAGAVGGALGFAFGVVGMVGGLGIDTPGNPVLALGGLALMLVSPIFYAVPVVVLSALGGGVGEALGGGNFFAGLGAGTIGGLVAAGAGLAGAFVGASIGGAVAHNDESAPWVGAAIGGAVAGLAAGTVATALTAAALPSE